MDLEWRKTDLGWIDIPYDFSCLASVLAVGRSEMVGPVLQLGNSHVFLETFSTTVREGVSLGASMMSWICSIDLEKV